jgi:hypothetical protein
MTNTVERRLRRDGIPTLTGRTAALLQAPAPVVARMLGYTLDHAARLVTEAGGTWSRYPAAEQSQ